MLPAGPPAASRRRYGRLLAALQGARRHAVGDTDSMVVDPLNAGDVRAVLQPWLVSDTAWVAEKTAATALTCEDQSPAAYATAPPDEATHKAVLYREQATVLRRSRFVQCAFTTASQWIEIARRLRGRCFPCLLMYTGHEVDAQLWVRSVAASFGRPLPHPRAASIQTAAQQLVDALTQALPLFATTGGMIRARLTITRMQPIYENVAQVQLEQDLAEFTALMKTRVAFPREAVVEDDADGDVVVSGFLVDPVARDAVVQTQPIVLTPAAPPVVAPPAASRAAEETLAAMLASRLLRKYVFDRGFAHLRRLTQRATLPLDAWSRSEFLMQRFEVRLPAAGAVMHDDVDGSIRTLAQTIPAERYADVCAAAEKRFRGFMTHWIKAVRTLLAEFRAHWRPAEEAELAQTRAKAEARRTQLLEQALALFPHEISLGLIAPTAVQREWRTSTDVCRWWHGSQRAAGQCDCDHDRASYARCLFRHLLYFAIKS